MKRPGFIAPVLFSCLPAAVFLQATLLANSLPGQVTPNLAFLLVVAAGYRLGAAGGSCAGMWGGALVGAASGALAVPFSCLYGVLGWLAGLHSERSPYKWTLPLVASALMALLISAESVLSLALEGVQPDLGWKLTNLLWMSLACLSFLGLPNNKKRGSEASR